MKVKAAILGPGNIGIDLMVKAQRSPDIEVALMAGIYEDSKGLQMAAERGVATTAKGIDGIVSHGGIQLVFDCTSAGAHLAHAPVLAANRMVAVDLTPAAVGPLVCPVVNGEQHLASGNVNLITCGGQATIPIVRAVNGVAPVAYAEIAATISSASAGPGTRQNIDEFTETTARALETVGGAEMGKAIILLNPAEPPVLMRNTIYLLLKDANYVPAQIEKAIAGMAARVREYVPGYRIKVGPLFDREKVTTIVEVEGAGDYLPPYSGNLDIITSAAVRIAEQKAKALREGGIVWNS